MILNKILVTGSMGFVGSNLVKYLSELDYLVYCLDLSNQGNSGKNITYIQQDLRQSLDFGKLPSDVDCIIHLAANMSKTVKSTEMFQTNTISTLNLLEYGMINGIKKFIFTSTGGVYGYNASPHTEKSQLNPIDFYTLSKIESEFLVDYYSRYFSTTIIRLFFPYGPGQRTGLIPLLTNKIKDKGDIIIYNKGNPKINPIYITDVINAIKKILSLEGHSLFNIAGNEIMTIKEIAQLIGNQLNSEPIFKYQEDSNIINLVGDNSKMKKILEIVPTKIEDGIRKYLSD